MISSIDEICKICNSSDCTILLHPGSGSPQIENGSMCRLEQQVKSECLPEKLLSVSCLSSTQQNILGFAENQDWFSVSAHESSSTELRYCLELSTSIFLIA